MKGFALDEYVEKVAANLELLIINAIHVTHCAKNEVFHYGWKTSLFVQ